MTIKPWVIIVGLCIALPVGRFIYHQAADGPLDRDSCLQKYAVNGATDLIVRAGYANCNTASDPEATKEQRKRAMCVLKNLPSLKADLGLRAAIQQCYNR